MILVQEEQSLRKMLNAVIAQPNMTMQLLSL